MKVVVNVNKDTSKLLTDLINKLNSTKMSDLDKSRTKLQRMIEELNEQLADSDEKTELINFFNEVVDDDEELVTIDEDPNIIDNKTLININTRKMNKKDLIKQELGEIESILKNKAYSQLLAKYQARVFSDVEGLEGEDVQEIKDRLDAISDQLEEISNSEAVSDESVEVSADEEVATEGAEESSETETETEVEATPEETPEEIQEESAEVSEEATEESTEEETKTESLEDDLKEIDKQAEESEDADKEALEAAMAEVDAAMEELREAVETKDFSKVIARVHSRLFSAIEEHQELIENIDEVKAAMDDLAEKIEKLDAEADEDESDKKEGEEQEVKDAEKAEEESDDAHEQEAEEAKDESNDESSEETKTESEDCWMLIKDGKPTGQKGTKEEMQNELDQFEGADRPHYAIKPCSEVKCESDETNETAEEVVEEVPAEETIVTEEKVEEPVETSEVPSTQEVEAIAEQAAEEAVEDYMENSLFMNETSDDMSGTEALVSPEVPEKESQVDPLFLDEDDAVLDVVGDEVVTESEDTRDELEDEELFYGDDIESDQAEFCNRTFSKNGLIKTKETKEYEIASIYDLLGL